MSSSILPVSCLPTLPLSNLRHIGSQKQQNDRILLARADERLPKNHLALRFFMKKVDICRLNAKKRYNDNDKSIIKRPC